MPRTDEHDVNSNCAPAPPDEKRRRLDRTTGTPAAAPGTPSGDPTGSGPGLAGGADQAAPRSAVECASVDAAAAALAGRGCSVARVLRVLPAARRGVAEGAPAIARPLSALQDTDDHSCYCAHSDKCPHLMP
jgi:hypothetical protein